MSTFSDDQNKTGLGEIFENSYDSIYVTDRFGNVLMANPAASRLVKIPLEQIVGSNVKDLIKRGVYDRSTALEAAEKKMMVTGLVRTGHGLNLMSTSMPIFDKKGEVYMVVTNSRDKDLVDKFLLTLEQERARTRRYKSVANYLGGGSKEDQNLVAESPAMRSILMTADTIAKADSTVMLLGESGTGKDMIARYIHRQSLRAREPFIPVNCAAIPIHLLEAEFFGYAKGAFTGANVQGKPGIFEIADKGTLFLDEIGELPLQLQSKLLRVLETSEVQRLGSTTTHHMDIRLVAATNRDLKQMVDQNLFRADLYYRLNVIPLYLPPLRERPEDIVALSSKFLEEYNKKYSFNRYFPEETLNALAQYSWPGNVRELKNVIERLVITALSDELRFNSDVSLVQRNPAVNFETSTFQGTLKDYLQQAEERLIQQVLKECNGQIGLAAKRMGIHRSVLYRKTH